jgi:hypothetical protein
MNTPCIIFVEQSQSHTTVFPAVDHINDSHYFSSGGAMVGLLKKIFGRISIISIALIIACMVFVNADAGKRQATQQQVSLYKAVIAVFSNSIPDTPEGWTAQPKNGLPDPGNSLPDADFPSQFIYQVEWNDPARKHAADEEIQKALAGLNNPSRRLEMEKSAADNREFTDRFVKKIQEAVDKKDWAAVELLNKEREEQEEKSRDSNQSHDGEAGRIVEKMEAHDVKVVISFSVNDFYGTFGPVLQVEPVAGFPAYRRNGWQMEATGWQEGITYVPLGTGWQIRKNGSDLYLEAKGLRGGTYTTIKNIMAGIQADPARAKQVAEKMDWNSLNGLTKN